MTALQIPDATVAAFTATYEAARGDGHSGIAYSFGMTAAAPLIVAAELRRFAAELAEEASHSDDGEYDWVAAAAFRLIDRADALDPPRRFRRFRTAIASAARSSLIPFAA